MSARISPSTVRYDVKPLDGARLLQPGTVSQLFDLEDADPAETVMVEMPLDDFLQARALIGDAVRELGRSVVVVLTDEAGRL